MSNFGRPSNAFALQFIAGMSIGALPLQSSNESEQKAIESIRLSSVSLDDGAKVFQRARESGLGLRAARLIRARLGP